MRKMYTDNEVAQKIIEAMEDNCMIAVPSILVPVVQESIVIAFEQMAHDDYEARQQAMIIADTIDGVFPLDERYDSCVDEIESVLIQVEKEEEIA